MAVKIVAVIPAHLASVRFARKILHPFYGLPMIEHVRRRALLSRSIPNVYVATCDEEIAETVRAHGGDVIMTANTHKNGTTRVAEAIANLDCTHVILLQGDEPLLLPRHLDLIAEAIRAAPDGDAWNATGPIEKAEQLDRHSFVKCAVSPTGRVLLCFRRTPFYAALDVQELFVRKILGLIAYRRDVLLESAARPASPIEIAEFIEQMRLIEGNYRLQSVPVSPSLPSVNEPHEADLVIEYVSHDPEQRALLAQVIG